MRSQRSSAGRTRSTGRGGTSSLISGGSFAGGAMLAAAGAASAGFAGGCCAATRAGVVCVGIAAVAGAGFAEGCGIATGAVAAAAVGAETGTAGRGCAMSPATDRIGGPCAQATASAQAATDASMRSSVAVNRVALPKAAMVARADWQVKQSADSERFFLPVRTGYPCQYNAR